MLNTGLEAKDFKKIATNGFGDPHNNTAWSMGWFKGKLYVGTDRDMAWWFARGGGFTYWDPFPIKLPPFSEMDLRAQIWRYMPETATWERVHISPMTTVPWRQIVDTVRRRRRRQPDMKTGRVVGMLLKRALTSELRIQVARDLGYRNMITFTDRHGSEALYVATIGPCGHILQTVDGDSFRVVSRPSFGIRGVTGFRPLVSLNGRLYTSPVGNDKSSNYSACPVVFETDDPARGAVDPSVWRPVSAPGFGDPDNVTVFEMAAFNGHLYAGTGNPNGFQVWKTDASGPLPYRWTQIVRNGGYKGPSANLSVISMKAFGDWLYVGGGHTPAMLHTLDPMPAEMIRIAPDDTWELVAGEPRDSDQGFKESISGLPAGFGNPFMAVIWRMEEHNGWLYFGTLDIATYLRYTRRDRMSERLLSMVEEQGGLERVVEAQGGFDLWRTADGVNWTPVTRNGFGNLYNAGNRTLKSTPVGLFVGSYNIFTEATDPISGKPRGGADVWLGSP